MDDLRERIDGVIESDTPGMAERRDIGSQLFTSAEGQGAGSVA